jgi:DNA-binding MarR family transcriptional regulator
MGYHMFSGAVPTTKDSPASLPESASQSILESIRRIVRGLRVSSKNAESTLGISGAQLFVLQRLAGSARLSLNELARRTLTHQSSVSVVVSRLVERGLVLRTPSKADARRLDLGLSAKGREFLKKVPPTTQERLILAIDKLPLRQRVELEALLKLVVMNAGLSEESPELFFESEKEEIRK